MTFVNEYNDKVDYELTSNPGPGPHNGELLVNSNISGGKYRGLRLLADEGGRFRMMAVDQRGSMIDGPGRRG